MEQTQPTTLRVDSINPLPNSPEGQHITFRSNDGSDSVLDLRVSGPYARQFENLQIGDSYDLRWPTKSSSK